MGIFDPMPRLLWQLYTAQFFTNMLWGLLLGSVFDAYLYEFAKSSLPHYQDRPNTFVGFVESLRGTTTLAIAFPAGYCVDSGSRVRVIRGNIMLGSFGVTTLVYGIWNDIEACLFIGIFLAAAYMQIFMAASTALYSDFGKGAISMVPTPRATHSSSQREITLQTIRDSRAVPLTSAVDVSMTPSNDVMLSASNDGIPLTSSEDGAPPNEPAEENPWTLPRLLSRQTVVRLTAMSVSPLLQYCLMVHWNVEHWQSDQLHKVLTYPVLICWPIVMFLAWSMEEEVLLDAPRMASNSCSEGSSTNVDHSTGGMGDDHTGRHNSLGSTTSTGGVGTRTNHAALTAQAAVSNPNFAAELALTATMATKAPLSSNVSNSSNSARATGNTSPSHKNTSTSGATRVGEENNQTCVSSARGRNFDPQLKIMMGDDDVNEINGIPRTVGGSPSKQNHNANSSPRARGADPNGRPMSPSGNISSSNSPSGKRPGWWHRPVYLEMYALFTMVGAGMTVKYFPLFFKNDYHFTPKDMCCLNFSYLVLTAFTTKFCTWVSETRFFRNPDNPHDHYFTVMVFHTTATFFLVCLSQAYALPLVLLFYLIRGALMNSRSPLVQSSIIRDVPREYRGRWSSLASVSRFSWAGSAALGGIISDYTNGYRETFLVTAAMYVGTLGLWIGQKKLVPP